MAGLLTQPGKMSAWTSSRRWSLFFSRMNSNSWSPRDIWMNMTLTWSHHIAAWLANLYWNFFWVAKGPATSLLVSNPLGQHSKSMQGWYHHLLGWLVQIGANKLAPGSNDQMPQQCGWPGSSVASLQGFLQPQQMVEKSVITSRMLMLVCLHQHEGLTCELFLTENMLKGIITTRIPNKLMANL